MKRRRGMLLLPAVGTQEQQQLTGWFTQQMNKPDEQLSRAAYLSFRTFPRPRSYAGLFCAPSFVWLPGWF